MKCNVSFIPSSFDFNSAIEELTDQFAKASALVGKMSTDFVQFSKSADFDDLLALAICSRANGEIGHIYSAAYDGNMSSTVKLEQDGAAVLAITNNRSPELDKRWVTLYSAKEGVILTSNPLQTIYSEEVLVGFCSNILIYNVPKNDEVAAQSFQDIYQNLVFRTDESGEKLLFNRLSKIDGGYVNYIKSITSSLSAMNNYELIPDDSLKNIDLLNVLLPVSVTPEGKGKSQRGVDELKRDFYINGCKYEKVNCEYHCKFEYPDGLSTSGKPKSNRLYFGFLKLDSKTKIAVAHIGEHW
ncbi:hypothetical protein KY858_004496 [Vibrio vulnificus]|uniref:hypothetical protein n=1 Tax=Vibrio vulnificus TaxID=672 RepID=UPI001CDB9345|nr:hypothetical protein [Vibrio vulnificus]EHH2477106.1 hypothetical protein [Vibrio vulnificus]EHH2479846.1 hypothetical protein [Vibrio vulnificus]EHH2486804.1 hypothetical protein [Vibrio vulnificus]EHH2489251.1 hypothetical protein [Vibrio vulnificus]EHU4796351.1 hypothetical protein [Vibrio vulnificus]